jgi:hypothetical protein
MRARSTTIPGTTPRVSFLDGGWSALRRWASCSAPSWQIARQRQPAGRDRSWDRSRADRSQSWGARYDAGFGADASHLVPGAVRDSEAQLGNALGFNGANSRPARAGSAPRFSLRSWPTRSASTGSKGSCSRPAVGGVTSHVVQNGVALLQAGNFRWRPISEPWFHQGRVSASISRNRRWGPKGPPNTVRRSLN